jgi:hypothetical protein
MCEGFVIGFAAAEYKIASPTAKAFDGNAFLRCAMN